MPSIQVVGGFAGSLYVFFSCNVNDCSVRVATSLNRELRKA